MSYEIVEELSGRRIEELCGLYRKEWWSKERRPEDVRRMLAHTDLAIGLCEPDGGPLVAFARVLTDFVYRATVFDVIVEESHRGRGLSRELMNAVILHPALSEVEHIDLFCLPDLVPLYRKYGFTDEVGGLRLMIRRRQT